MACYCIHEGCLSNTCIGKLIRYHSSQQQPRAGVHAQLKTAKSEGDVKLMWLENTCGCFEDPSGQAITQSGLRWIGSRCTYCGQQMIFRIHTRLKLCCGFFFPNGQYVKMHGGILADNTFSDTPVYGSLRFVHSCTFNWFFSTSFFLGCKPLRLICGYIDPGKNRPYWNPQL